MLLGALILAALGSLATDDDALSSFSCRTTAQVSSANVSDVDAAYVSQSINIITRALEGDGPYLARVVDPTAKFTLFAGDLGIGPRSNGFSAAIEYVKQISPSRYSFSTGSSGPFSTQPCGDITVEGTLIGEKPAEAVIASFKYRGGILVEIQSSRVSLTTGSF